MSDERAGIKEMMVRSLPLSSIHSKYAIRCKQASRETKNWYYSLIRYCLCNYYRTTNPSPHAPWLNTLYEHEFGENLIAFSIQLYMNHCLSRDKMLKDQVDLAHPHTYSKYEGELLAVGARVHELFKGTMESLDVIERECARFVKSARLKPPRPWFWEGAYFKFLTSSNENDHPTTEPIWIDVRYAYDGVESLLNHAEKMGYRRETCDAIRNFQMTGLVENDPEAFQLCMIVYEGFKVRVITAPHHYVDREKSYMACCRCETIKNGEMKKKQFLLDPLDYRIYCQNDYKIKPTTPRGYCNSKDSCYDTECLRLNFNGTLVEFFGRTKTMCKVCKRQLADASTRICERCLYGKKKISCKFCMKRFADMHVRNCDRCSKRDIKICYVCNAVCAPTNKKPWKHVWVFGNGETHEIYFCANEVKYYRTLQKYPYWTPRALKHMMSVLN